jgi:D-beta-D-heptose 7-phosphate kinase/D-beta-D-heptose 1-phosphate adenosyltransferase
MDSSRVAEVIRACRKRRIAVVGDLMLDTYVFGKANRISQEAPVPVVQIRNQSRTLGGAANVMRNLASLGADVSAYGVVGEDETGKNVFDLLAVAGIRSDGVAVSRNRRTTEKKRVIAGSQQLLRIDYEDTHPVDMEIRNRMMACLIEQIRRSELDAIIFEDYAKGLLEKEMVENVLGEAKAHGVKVALDPHPGHPLHVRGLTLMTPNRSEAFGLAGVYHSDPPASVEEDRALTEVASILMRNWSPELLLITLGAQGMILFGPQGNPQVIPTRAREVFDVSGAGDTVIAVFTIALLAGASAHDAAEIANHAAGIVVGKVGTVSVDPEELLDSFIQEEHHG